MDEDRRRLTESILEVAVSGKEILWSPTVVANVRALEARAQTGQDPEVRILLGNYWLIRWRATRQRSALRKAAAALSDFETLTKVITSDGAADAVDAAAAQAQSDCKIEIEKVERGEDGADPDAAITLSAFVLAHMRLADTAYLTTAQRNLAYAYWVSGRSQGSLDHLAQALTLSLEAVGAEPDGTALSRQLIADIASGVTVFAEATPTRFLQNLQEQFVPRARRYAADGYRPDVLYAGLGAVALTAWHADGDQNALDEACSSLEQVVDAAEIGTEVYIGAKANLGAAALLRARASGRLDDFHQAIVLINEAASLAEPDHRFYPNIHLVLASAYQQRFWGFDNPGDRAAANEAAQRAFKAIRDQPIRGLRDLQLYAKHACGLAEVAEDLRAVADLLTSIGKLRQDWAEALSMAPTVAGRVDEAHGLLALRLASHRDADLGLLATAAADLTHAVSAAELVSEQRSRLGKLGQTLELIGLHHPSPQAWTELVTVAEALVELAAPGPVTFDRGVAAHNLAIARIRQALADVEAGADAESYLGTVEAIVELELAAVASVELPARQRLQNTVATAELIDSHWPGRSVDLWEAASTLLTEVAAWYLPLRAREEILHRFADVAPRAADRLLGSNTKDAISRALTVLRRDSHILATQHQRLRQLNAALDRHPHLSERYQDLVAAILSEETWKPRSTWQDQARFDAHQELESLVRDLLAASSGQATADLPQDFTAGRAWTVHLFAGPERTWALITGAVTVPVALPATSYQLETIAADIPTLAEMELDQLRAAAASAAPGEVPRQTEGGSELLQALRWLGDAVVEPVLDALAQPAASEPEFSLHWVLHGRLAGLPLHAAVLGEVTRHGVNSPEYLFDRCESTIGLTDAAPESGIDTTSRAVPPTLLVVGAPNDGRSRLVQADSELAIAKASGPWVKTMILTGDEATVEQTIDQLRHADVVHFALHGDADEHHPSQSALHLTGASLTVEHLLGLDLGHVQLGNLSACETAVVAAARLRSESLSTATGFHLAGLTRVIATLWSVPDRPTRDFNAEFYSRIWKDGQFRPNRAAAAVREAMIAVRDRSGLFAWPSTWAGFVLLGDRPDQR